MPIIMHLVTLTHATRMSLLELIFVTRTSEKREMANEYVSAYVEQRIIIIFFLQGRCEWLWSTQWFEATKIFKITPSATKMIWYINGIIFCKLRGRCNLLQRSSQKLSSSRHAKLHTVMVTTEKLMDLGWENSLRTILICLHVNITCFV